MEGRYARYTPENAALSDTSDTSSDSSSHYFGLHGLFRPDMCYEPPLADGAAPYFTVDGDLCPLTLDGFVEKNDKTAPETPFAIEFDDPEQEEPLAVQFLENLVEGRGLLGCSEYNVHTGEPKGIADDYVQAGWHPDNETQRTVFIDGKPVDDLHDVEKELMNQAGNRTVRRLWLEGMSYTDELHYDPATHSYRHALVAPGKTLEELPTFDMETHIFDPEKRKLARANDDGSIREIFYFKRKLGVRAGKGREYAPKGWFGDKVRLIEKRRRTASGRHSKRQLHWFNKVGKLKNRYRIKRNKAGRTRLRRLKKVFDYFIRPSNRI